MEPKIVGGCINERTATSPTFVTGQRAVGPCFVYFPLESATLTTAPAYLSKLACDQTNEHADTAHVM